MAHRFLVKDIAFQAGTSTATVDRVLNGRPGVREQTRLRITAAIRELENQEASVKIPAQTFGIDVIIEAPERFTETVRHAFERESLTFLPTIFRTRFHVGEVMRPTEIVRLLDHARLRRTGGVVLKAPDLPEIREAVTRLEQAAIPVVTLVTDLANTPRTAYAGADNRSAGETAAYLIGERFADRPATVLVTLSSGRFRGEEEREIGFRHILRQQYRHLAIVEISEGQGRDEATGTLARAALESNPGINAVYSIGGGNRAVLAAFKSAKRTCHIFVAHDLDAGNRDLLMKGDIQFVLHHDLKTDVRTALRAILGRRASAALPPPPSMSAVEVITPYNIPAL